MTRLLQRGALPVVAVMAAIAAHAQTQTLVPNGRRELIGMVRDARGLAIEGATVEIQGGGTRTNTFGLFRLWTPEIDTVTIAIRRPGFAPVEALISARNKQWDTLMVELDQIAQRLPEATVSTEKLRRTGLIGFDERSKQQNGGLYINRAEIVARGGSRLTDVLQSRRGIHLTQVALNRYGVRFATYSGPKNGCVPDIWVDGQRARGMELDDLPPGTVEAMELYDTFATVPIEFSASANSVPCGTIVVWTRPPGTKQP